MNGFSTDAVFTEKNMAHVLVTSSLFGLTNLNVIYDLLTVSQIWPSNHQLS